MQETVISEETVMDARKISVAEACREAAYGDTMTFPQIVGLLMQAGFEGYLIDFRRRAATYYTPEGETLELETHPVDAAMAPAFDAAPIKAAIKEAQQRVADYSYNGFCRKIVAAGCAGYMVSFSGKRALYFGRTGEMHVEHFPQ
jgi:uncharacterized protein YbcV (DUF1398 family)